LKSPSAMPEKDVFASPDLRRSGAGYINPARLRQHPEWQPDWVAYVLFKTSEERTRPTRVLITRGPLHHSGGPLDGLTLKINDVIRLRHERSMVVLGVYKIAGIARSDTGLTLGDVPDRMIRRCES